MTASQSSKRGREPRLPPHPRPRVVNHPDPHPVDLHDVLLRQRSLQGRLVHVPVDSFDGRPERAQLVEELHRHEIAAVEDKVGAREQAHALVRKHARAAREMRVRDDGDPGQEATTGSGARTLDSWRKRPDFQTSSPSA